jgi:hypothetical membrane protein
MAAPTLPERQLTASPPRSGPAATTSTAAQHRPRNSKVAGLVLSLAGTAILMGFITAEALYPGLYTTHTNTVSHLGASEPPNSVVLRPAAAIFDITMLVAGAMILAGAWFAYRALGRKAMLIPTVLLGVGVFPLTHPAPHTLFAFTAFLAGGIAVVLSSRVTTAPFRSLWTTLGAIALGATVLALDAFRSWAPMVGLGEGGLERWIVYPIVLWLVAFGSYLLAIANPTDARNPAGAGGC